MRHWHALKSSYWELSISACPVSLRRFVPEISRGANIPQHGAFGRIPHAARGLTRALDEGDRFCPAPQLFSRISKQRRRTVWFFKLIFVAHAMSSDDMHYDILSWVSTGAISGHEKTHFEVSTLCCVTVLFSHVVWCNVCTEFHHLLCMLWPYRGWGTAGATGSVSTSLHCRHGPHHSLRSTARASTDRRARFTGISFSGSGYV